MREFYDYQGYFMRFLELIAEEQEENPAISSFLEFFDSLEGDKLYVKAPPAGPAVKILTIHKAKGLEFPAVIIPFLEMNIKTDNEGVLNSKNELTLVRIKKRYADFSPLLESVYRKDLLSAFIDELNNIYVAFTRAEEELHVFIPSRTENRVNSAQFLLAEDNFQRGRIRQDRINPYQEADPAIEIPPSSYQDWIHLLKEEFVDGNTLKQRDKILKGRIMHAVLSFIGSLYKQDKQTVVKQAVEKARAQFISAQDDLFKEAAGDIGRMIGSKQLKPYFEIKEGEVFLEKEVTDSFGNARRIDRLIVYPQELLIIDFKSSRPDSGPAENSNDYKEQITQYKRIMSDIYPDKTVKGLLVYLDDLSIEEV